jgi:hypothetical protein
VGACIGLNWLKARSCAADCEEVSESRGSMKVKEFLKSCFTVRPHEICSMKLVSAFCR